MKIVTVLLTAVMLTSCHDGNTPDNETPHGLMGGEYLKNGMHYWIYANSEFGVIVNLTKDSLECEYYKKQLAK